MMGCDSKIDPTTNHNDNDSQTTSLNGEKKGCRFDLIVVANHSPQPQLTFVISSVNEHKGVRTCTQAIPLWPKIPYNVKSL